MSIQHIRTPMTAAALALLLAACGGGSDGGSERVVSSSPAAPGASNTVNVNVDANSTAIAGSAADSAASPNGAGSAPAPRPGGSTGGSGEANAVGAGSATAGSNGNGNSSSSGSGASATAPTPAPAPTPGADAGAPAATPSPGTPTPPPSATPPASGDAGSVPPSTSPAPGADAGSAAPTPPATPTPPAAPTPPAPPAATPAEVAPISAQGIRGDVFLAMLEQKPCGHDGLQPANGPDGSKGSEGMVNFFAETDLGNYKRDPNYFIVGFRHGFGCNGKIYEPVQPGEHTFSIDNSVFAKAYTPPRPFNMFHMEVPVSLTADDVLLGNSMKTTSVAMSHTPTITSQRFETPLTADTPYRVKLNEMVPFGVLKQWSNGEQSEQLMILQGGNAQEARMCWNTSLTHIKRLQCMIWGVPADWKAGGKLNPVNVTLEEDRSVYEGETGKAYWD